MSNPTYHIHQFSLLNPSQRFRWTEETLFRFYDFNRERFYGSWGGRKKKKRNGRSSCVLNDLLLSLVAVRHLSHDISRWPSPSSCVGARKPPKPSIAAQSSVRLRGIPSRRIDQMNLRNHKLSCLVCLLRSPSLGLCCPLPYSLWHNSGNLHCHFVYTYNQHHWRNLIHYLTDNTSLHHIIA